ncbi:MAG: CoA-binding protein [Salibacteraceae bacterium]
MKSFNTAVIGASPNQDRYAFKAVKKLTDFGFKAIPLGFRSGEIDGNTILTDWPKKIDNLKVITLYLGPSRQPEFYNYIISLKPKTVIFNPGTENAEFYNKLEQANINFEEACTLVLLSTGAYENI